MKQTPSSEEHTSDASYARFGEGNQERKDLFLRNIWYVAGWSSEFKSSLPLGRTIIDEHVVLYRTTNGKLVALEDRCAHRWAPLSLGRVEGDNLRCMYHGVKYGADGRCVEIPGQDRVAKTLCVRTYPVIEKFRFVWVWMGDAGMADPNLIPDLSMLDQTWRRVYVGNLDYEASYFLINDNLLDLSHLSFLHEKTLGRPVSTPMVSRPKPRILGGSEAKPLHNGVRVEGWQSGLHSRIVTLPKNVPDGDYWSRVDYLVPGIYIALGQMYPDGTAEECKGLPPGAERVPLSDGMGIQAVTPMTTRQTRYYFSVGLRASDMEQEESEAVWDIVKEAFSEDLQMIHAQQRMIDTYPGQRMAGIAADRGLVLFRNLMKRLIADETSVAGLERHRSSPLR